MHHKDRGMSDATPVAGHSVTHSVSLEDRSTDNSDWEIGFLIIF